jgi:hypothetical protein
LLRVKYTLKNMYLLARARRSPFGAYEFLYCAAVHIQRKTATMMGKMVVLPPLSPSQLAVGKPKISAGGTATGFMTNGAHITVAKDEYSVRGRARAQSKPRPSLGSSYALLLLMRP